MKTYLHQICTEILYCVPNETKNNLSEREKNGQKRIDWSTDLIIDNWAEKSSESFDLWNGINEKYIA